MRFCVPQDHSGFARRAVARDLRLVGCANDYGTTFESRATSASTAAPNAAIEADSGGATDAAPDGK